MVCRKLSTGAYWAPALVLDPRTARISNRSMLFFNNFILSKYHSEYNTTDDIKSFYFPIIATFPGDSFVQNITRNAIL